MASSPLLKFWRFSRDILQILDTKAENLFESWLQTTEASLLGVSYTNSDQQLAKSYASDPFVWFATPKRRTSHSKKRLRMTHKWLKPIRHYTFCNHCGNPKLLHVLCGNCFKDIMKKTAEHRRKQLNEKTVMNH